MSTIWPSLMMVVMVCGVCLSMPSDDRQEPRSSVVANSSAHEGARESKAVSMPSLDLSVQEPRLIISRLKMLDFRTILEMVLRNAFGLKGVLDKDSLLATDAVDESWAKWIRNVYKFLPVIPVKSIDSQNIENPLDDAPNPLWDYLLAFLLKSQNFVSVDDQDGDSDGEEKEENAVSSTTVSFDPIGQLFSMMKDFVTSVAKSHSVTDWWYRVKEHFKTYSVFTEENTDASGKGDKDFALGIFDYFTQEYTFGEHDLLKFAINTLIFLGFRSLFLRSYFPNQRTDYMESYPDYMTDYDYGDEEEYGEAEGDEEEGYMQNDEDQEEEEGYNQYGEDEGEEEEDNIHYDYDQEEDQEEGGYNHYDDGGDEGQEVEEYYQYSDNQDDNQGGEESSYTHYDNHQGEEESSYTHYDNHQGGEESSYTHYGKENQRNYQLNNDDGFNDQNFNVGYWKVADQDSHQEAGQGFDPNVHQEVGHNANLGFLKSAYQGLAEGANQGSNGGFEQGSNHGFDQSTKQGVDASVNGFYPSSHQGESHGFDHGQNQGFDQSFDSSHQSSYQSYSEGLKKDFDQNIPVGEENTDRRRHARDWPKPTFTNLSPEFNHGRNTYQRSNIQRQDDTHPRNRLRWRDIYKNNYSYQQDSYWQQHPHRNSYTYERDTIYRNSYGQQVPYRNSYVYRRNSGDNKGHGPGDRRPHAATRSISILGKK
ncbi:uncharacterized protein [Panulirus ornatus]|uniref:uncharacterized protein n=1 Tax=Panulirus ornatus TaxID=150431 RepID=UPI003A845FCB